MTDGIETLGRTSLRCRICGRDLAPEEVAREFGENVFCGDCVGTEEYMQILSEQHSVDSAAMMATIKPLKKRNKKAWLLSAAALIIAAQIGYLLFFMPPLPHNRYLVAEGDRVKYVNKLDVSIENIGKYIGALDKYRAEHGSYPNSLIDLVPEYLDSLLVCPASGQPYVYENRGDCYWLESPDPQAHDIYALTCDGKGGPPFILKNDSQTIGSK